MSRVERQKTSYLDSYPLSSSSSRQALSVFSQLLSSCAGPHGRNQIVRNTCGGHMTITSTCVRLLSSMSVSRSELKLVVSAITGHLQQRGDCGLFMSHMCLHLTKSMLDLNIHHSVTASAFQSFVSIIVDYIQSDSCDVCVKADFSNVKVLLAYVKSIFTSKTLLNIKSEELKDLSLIVLNAFVKAIPSVPNLQCVSSGIFVLGLEKQPIKNCKSVDGIMLEFPEFLSIWDSSKLKLKWEVKDNSEPYLKIALITCSMSGDMDNVASSTLFEGTEDQFNAVEECVLEKMAMLCNVLERESVAIVLCQRVIHPRIKKLLASKNMLFVDRLGSQPIPFIRDLAGCRPITSILQNIQKDDGCLGKLTSIVPCTENGKQFICLKNANSNITSLVVCAEWEERLSELKECVTTCLQGLESLVKEPRLLMGGGCWQMYCSHVLQEVVLSTLPEMSKKLSCTEHTLRQLLTVFSSCLHQWCFSLKRESEHLSFDPTSRHCWRVDKNFPVSLSVDKLVACCCGVKAMSFKHLQDLGIVLTQRDSIIADEGNLSESHAVEVGELDHVVLDNPTACVEAFHKGVLTAGLLLSIGQFVCDRN